MRSNFHIFEGNHLEVLAEALAVLVHAPQSGAAADPLRPEIVMVQSKGMGRWLSLAIAKHNGICANMEFPFPNAFLETTYEKVIGPLPENDPFEPQALTFRIMGWLDDLIALEQFSAIRDYISGPGRSLKHFQLSSKIADMFDQYLVFRPELIASWESERSRPAAGPPEWQAMLWAKLTAETDAPHRATLQRELVSRLRQPALSSADLPDRISVFGISHLPPFHLNVLDALSRQIPVHLFLFNPCRQFWTDIVSEHQLIKERSKMGGGDLAFDDLHFEKGNRLLSSWGHHGRQFHYLIHQMDIQTTELFVENKKNTLLGKIQQDILDLVDRPADRMANETHLQDHSLRIHACHSPMREVEVLFDQLLDILDSNPDIYPADILIMTPDIATYAPLIHGVFGGPEHGGSDQIPYTVADQNVPRESRVVQAFLGLLNFRESRFEVSAVLELLEFSCIRRKFGFQEADTALLERWIADVNIRWGWDGPDRSRHGLPRFEENTWRKGLDRLLLGYAVGSENDRFYCGLLPHQEGIEGSDSALLGRFVLFAETLHLQIRRIPESASLKEWSKHLLGLLEVFFAADNDRAARDLQVLRAVLEKMEQISVSVGRAGDIDFDVAHQFIRDTLDRASYGGGFMSGGVTFCAMLPMRSIPAQVIGILGLQHDVFPQEDHEPGFNLMTETPKPGDRSKRNDDKYLFLEALLSARRIFYISYVGRDIQDNSPIPPSVLVSELFEYIDAGFGISESQLLTVQPLQAFSPQYFTKAENRLFSYSRENCAAARHLNEKHSYQPFFKTALPSPGIELNHVTLPMLIAYYAHPSKFLLQRRLGIAPLETASSIEDRENFNLDGLQQFLVRQAIVKTQSQDKGVQSAYASLNATGSLPHGTFGRALYDHLGDGATRFFRMVKRYTGGSAARMVPFAFSIPPFQVSGGISDLYRDGRMTYRLANVRSEDLMHCFIVHLAMNLLDDPTVPCRSILLCRDKSWRFGPIDTAQKTLEDYLKLYWQGLHFPLPLFPRSSFAYAYQRIVKDSKREQALAAAVRTWNGNRFQGGEHDDACLNLVFGENNPMTVQFEELAMRIYTPLFGAGQPFAMDR